MENKPTHYVYQVTDAGQEAGDDASGYWTKIGAAWPHKDGKGFSISMVAIPYNGRVVVRERPEEEAPAPQIETDSVAA